jgi:predicted ArsR family transcriptional regulator
MRRRVLDTVLQSVGPIDAAGVAAQLGLHVTTVRFHLEQLERAALIRRSVERAGSRGRPRVLFAPAPSARGDGAQRDLTDALASALADDDDGGRSRAIRAGEAWSEQFRPGLTRAAAERGTTASLVALFDTLGFDPQVADGSPDGPETAMDGTPALTAIELHACPFRDEARRNPSVVCSVHLGLLRGAARTLGQDPDETGLRPFVQPELCVVDLDGDWR